EIGKLSIGINKRARVDCPALGHDARIMIEQFASRVRAAIADIAEAQHNRRGAIGAGQRLGGNTYFSLSPDLKLLYVIVERRRRSPRRIDLQHDMVIEIVIERKIDLIA